MGTIKPNTFLQIFKNICYDYINERNKIKHKELFDMMKIKDNAFINLKSSGSQNIEPDSFVRFEKCIECKNMDFNLDKGLIHIEKNGVYSINLYAMFEDYSKMILCVNSEEKDFSFSESDDIIDNNSNKLNHYLVINRLLKLNKNDILSIKNINSFEAKTFQSSNDIGNVGLTITRVD
jgi:hypothetical protein